MKQYLPLLFLALSRHPLRVSAANGTCISSPQSACASLVGICVSKIATSQIASNKFWSSPECFAAATCAGSAAVVDAACCAGTCISLTSIDSLDYNAVYAPMVGDCAFQPGGCPVTWTDYVNYFYNTIQATNTNNWPITGDDVLRWWADIATWTAFCSGTNCVNGQIPYTNFNDWLRFSSATIITTPGNPPIREPPSSNRDENADVWDPTPDSPCPFKDQSLCFSDNTPQEPPDSSTLEARDIVHPPRPKRALATLALKLIDASSRSSFVPGPSFLPPNVPSPVYITNGTEKVRVQLNLAGGNPPARRQYALVPKSEPLPNKRDALMKRLSQDVCGGGRVAKPTDTPATLPVLTYYCDYMPTICAGIRRSGELASDEVILTYDPFGSGKRRNSVCTAAQRLAFRSGGCDLKQHDPEYWNLSCDEFPMNSVLEGGLANGAIVTAVPTREQRYQGILHTALTQLQRVENDARTQWSRPSSNKVKWSGQCHTFKLKLVNTRPVGTSSFAIGTLFSGSAFRNHLGDQYTETIEDSRAQVPPAARLTNYDYPSTAAAIGPPGTYKSFDCRPCTIGSVPQTPAARALLNTFNNATRVVKVPEVAAAAGTCTKNKPTSTPTPTSDAAQNAAEAAAAAAAAAEALAAATAEAATIAAATAAVKAAQAAAVAAAAAAAAAIANTPAAMASTLAAGLAAQTALQTAIATLTNIFGPGSIPAEIASVIEQATTVASSVSSVLNDTWNTKPAASDPVPQDADPVHNPALNNGGGANVPPAACFGAGSSAGLVVSGGFIWLATGTNSIHATLSDEGSPAYFGVTAGDTRFNLGALCPGVYVWLEGAGPNFQVSCSTKEFGSYWNAGKQQCYVFPDKTSGYNVVCANDVGSIYSCLQGNGYQSQITAVSFSWSP
ncbi:hypothetical protein C8R43DRAFT_968952 [Mycena crocata]|nr:hypothetical protein C8R43DRAFT_968952 [Mycena crocata]